ncbi:MAG: glucose 1-dehydrogenase [Acidobacteria bacterium]|nr:glucose 1-dehydrogenase [Acidobacteriota bacterium]
MSDKKLQGKIAIVSGASSGIGQGIAVRLGRDGASVVVDYRHDKAGGDETIRQIQAAGGKALLVQADVSKLDDIQKLVDATWEKFGKADILVNNAGVEKGADFWEVSEKDYDMVLDVNLKGPFFLTQAFVKKLIEKNIPGRVINISSVHEDMVFPHFASYCAAKGGLRMLMRDLCVELGPKNITVNNIAPGAISTPINTALLNDKPKLNALLNNIPLGRLGSVDDVAGLAAFLASDEAAYITGSTYVIDGGLMRNYKEQ